MDAHPPHCECKQVKEAYEIARGLEPISREAASALSIHAGILTVKIANSGAKVLDISEVLDKTKQVLSLANRASHARARHGIQMELPPCLQQLVCACCRRWTSSAS